MSFIAELVVVITCRWWVCGVIVSGWWNLEYLRLRLSSIRHQWQWQWQCHSRLYVAKPSQLCQRSAATATTAAKLRRTIVLHSSVCLRLATGPYVSIHHTTQRV